MRTYQLEGVTYTPFVLTYWLQDEPKKRRRLTVYAPGMAWVREPLYRTLDDLHPYVYRVLYTVRDVASGETWRITDTGFFIPKKEKRAA